MRFPGPYAGIVLMLLFLTASCVREDVEGCMQYALNVKVVDAQGNDLTASGVMKKAEVYLFGEEGFIRMVQAGAGSDFCFAGEKGKRLTLVAWGNVKEDTLETTEVLPGTFPEEARLLLKRKQAGRHLPVTDLFYCRRVLNSTATRGMQQADDIMLVMERRSACVSIRTYNLAGRYPHSDGECRFIVHGTGTEMDFNGQVAGEAAGYGPDVSMDAQGDGYAPPFRIFPTREGERIQVDVYRGAEKLCTVDSDKYGVPLCAPVGKLTEIGIDFRPATAEVTVVVRQWEGQTEQDTEM